MNSVFFLAIFGTFILSVRPESVENRMKAAFGKLSQNCQDNVKDYCPDVEEFRNFKSYSDRTHPCIVSYKVRHKECLRRNDCSSGEIGEFFDKMCDFHLFNKIRTTSGLMIKFSSECRTSAGYKQCIQSRKTDGLLQNEDFCKAFEKDGELEECFEEVELCDNDRDEEVFDKIRDVACSGAAETIYSVMLMITCLFVGGRHL